MIRGFIRQIKRNKRWRNTVTCMAALVVFVTTYVLILPAITLEGAHPRLSAEAVTAWAGDPMSVTISAESPSGSGEKVVVLTAEAVDAGLSEAYVFDSDGVAVIEDSMGQEIRLHRTVREGVEDRCEYWFVLAAGQRTEFTLDLQDEIDVNEVMASAGIVKNIRTEKDDKDAEKASASDADKAEAAAAAEDKAEDATASDAVKVVAAEEEATASSASKATPADAEEEDDDGKLADGMILNDLDISDFHEETEITATLKLMAGMGDDLDEAVRDAERNAEKRGDASLEYRWRAVITNSAEELSWGEDGVSVKMFFTADAQIPEDARLSVTEIPQDSEEYKAYLESAKGAVSSETAEDGGQKIGVNYARFFDIKILDAEGNEIEPEAQVVVKIDYDKAENITEDTGVQMVHFPKEGGTELVDAVVDGEGEELNGIAFSADGFSVYGIVGTYTVDFHWEVNGQTYDFSIPGGGCASLEQVVELLGIAKDKKVAAAGTDADNAGALTLKDLEISEETRKFVANVVNVEFSAPELVRVARAAENTTVGDLRNALGVECEYSAELTEEEIAQINTQAVEAGDWALLALKAFDTEETLTVTMENGEVFAIKVTDDHVDTSGDIVSGNLYYLYTYSSTRNYAVAFDGRAQIIDDLENPDLDNSFIWKFTKQSTGWVIQNYAIPQNYIYLSSSDVIGASRVLNLKDRTDGNEGFDISYSSYNLAIDGNANPREKFTVGTSASRMRLLDATPKPLTLHFVDEQGNELREPVVVEHDASAGDYIIDLEREYGSIDTGGKSYTLGSTRKGSYTDLFDNPNHKWEQPWEQPHRIIGNQLRWNQGKLQYRFFFTNNGDDCNWYDIGTRPNIGEKDSSSTKVPVPDGDDCDKPRDDSYTYMTEGIYDYYLVYNERPVIPGPEPDPEDDPELDDIGVIKNLNNNYDGTYTLELGASVPAETKALKNAINVVVVFDTSSSMLRSTVDGKYPPAYQEARDDNTDVDPDPYLAPRETSNEIYANSRYRHAVDALTTFVHTLKSNLPTENAVMLSLISFNKEAYQIGFGAGGDSAWTTDGEEFLDKLLNLHTFPGTNWADGLYLADQLAEPDVTVDGQPRDAKTYVLFVTDGGPSQYWHDTEIPGNTFFTSGECSYLGAKNDGRAVIRDGKTMYGVFAFGSDEDEGHDYIGQLVDYAYDDPGASNLYAFYAQTSAALAERLNSIVQILAKDFTYADVTINDGITNMTEVTFEADDDNKEEFSYEITYRDYYEKEGGDVDYNTVTLDLTDRVSGSGNNQIITIPTLTYHYLENGVIVEKQIEEEQIAGAVFTPASGGNHKKVVWDIKPAGAAAGSHYDPHPGWTYKVRFKIWPDQDTYDILAALNNGLLNWGDPYKGSTDYMDQIYQEAGRYVEKTNVQEEAFVNYSQHTKVITAGGTQDIYTPPYPESLPEVGGMPLDNTEIWLKKVWNTDLSQEDYDKIQAVDLYILKDNESAAGFNKADPSTYYMKVTLSKDNGWKAHVSIAPGIYDVNEKYKTTGHVYSVVEPDIDPHYELEATPVHPMLDGRTHTEAEQWDMIDVYETEDPAPFAPDDHGVYVYSVDNTLKGGINIYKEIEDGTDYDPEALFTFEVNLADKDGNPVSGSADREGDIGYRIILPSGKPIPAGATGVTDTQYTFHGNTFIKQENGSYIARGGITGGSVTLQIRSCEFIRIANVPMGTTYTVEELALTDFEFVQARVGVKSGDDPETVIEIVTEPDDPETSEHTIVPDAENNVYFKNRYLTFGLKIVKIEKDHTEKPLAHAKFEIRRIKDTLGASGIEYDGPVIAQVETDVQGEAEFSGIVRGYYEIKETDTPDGYVITGDKCFYIKVHEGATYLLKKEDGEDPKDWDDSQTVVGNVTFTAATASEDATAQVENTPGGELPQSGGPGTLLYTLGGTALVVTSALMYGFRMRLRRKEGYY